MLISLCIVFVLHFVDFMGTVVYDDLGWLKIFSSDRSQTPETHGLASDVVLSVRLFTSTREDKMSCSTFCRHDYRRWAAFVKTRLHGPCWELSDPYGKAPSSVLNYLSSKGWSCVSRRPCTSSTWPVHAQLTRLNHRPASWPAVSVTHFQSFELHGHELHCANLTKGFCQGFAYYHYIHFLKT